MAGMPLSAICFYRRLEEDGTFDILGGEDEFVDTMGKHGIFFLDRDFRWFTGCAGS